MPDLIQKNPKDKFVVHAQITNGADSESQDYGIVMSMRLKKSNGTTTGEKFFQVVTELGLVYTGGMVDNKAVIKLHMDAGTSYAVAFISSIPEYDEDGIIQVKVQVLDKPDTSGTVIAETEYLDAYSYSKKKFNISISLSFE